MGRGKEGEKEREGKGDLDRERAFYDLTLEAMQHQLCWIPFAERGTEFCPGSRARLPPGEEVARFCESMQALFGKYIH